MVRQINDKVSAWWLCVIEVYKKNHMAHIQKKSSLKGPIQPKILQNFAIEVFILWKSTLPCYLVSRGNFWKWYHWPISLHFSPHTVILTCDRYYVTQAPRRTIRPNISKVILCIKDSLVKASMYCSTFLWLAQPTPRTLHPQNSIHLPICDS